METLLIDNKDEAQAITTINNYLESRRLDKRKKEVCIVFNEKPSNGFFKQVLLIFFNFKSAYLKMIKYEKESKCNLEKTVIHSGEEVYCLGPKIIVGNVNNGALLRIKNNVVFIGEVHGTIILEDDKSSIYADKFANTIFIDRHNNKKVFSGEKYLMSYEEMEAM